MVIPLAAQHYMLLQRNLIYTGITRGKRLLSDRTSGVDWRKKEQPLRLSRNTIQR